MKKPIFLVAFLFPIFLFSQNITSGVLEFKNGSVWTGEKFEPLNFFVVGTKISLKKPPVEVSRMVDLTGQFVIPPLADAGSVSFDGVENYDFVLKSYLNEGVFYVAQTNNSQNGRMAVSEKLKMGEAPDVFFANGVLTCTNGEPSIDIEMRAVRQKFPQEWQSKMATARANPLLFNDAYWFIDSETAFNTNWPRIELMKPDFLQISLRDVENGPRHGGLSPEIAKMVVKKAHKSNIRVFANIETAADFRAALDAGVDVVSNLPGFTWDGNGSPAKFELTEKDLSKAKKKKVTVVSSYSKSVYLTGSANERGVFVTDSVRSKAVKAFHVKMLTQILDKKIPIALASEEWGRTPRSELNYIFQLSAFSAAQMLKMQTENSIKAIYPTRKVGKIAKDFEASFLILEGDPTKNILNMRRILMKVKDGVILKSADAKKEVK